MLTYSIVLASTLVIAISVPLASKYAYHIILLEYERRSCTFCFFWPRCTHPENLGGIIESWQRRRDPGGRLNNDNNIQNSRMGK